MKIFLAVLFLIFFGVIHEAHAVPSCQCVVFRMDDVQDYWLNDVQVGIIHEFEQKNASLTAGIIGNYFGQDGKVVGAVSDALKQDEPKFVVANHGWNHENFTTFSRDEQSALIHNANQKISDILGITPDIFIAPYNSINNDTLISLLDNNMVYLSANEVHDRPPYVLSDAAFFRFPETAKVGDLNKENTVWVDLNHDQTYAAILRSIVKYGFAVVLLHPQDYANKHPGPVYDNMINQTRIHELDLLIDKIRNDGYSMVTMNDIPKNAIYDTTYPKWLDRVFSLYFTGKISDSEMTNSVEYMKSKKMITSSLASEKYSLHTNISGEYPLHANITATYFWIGEPADADNQYISNTASAWDDKWMRHYGGVDDPKNRDQYMPSDFTPNENPFYFALPYNDFDDNGTRKSDAYDVVYWANEKTWDDSESMVKNRWIEITKGDKTVYAQWEDSGPFVYDDSDYVFGDAQPENTVNHNAGLDVSPAVKDYLDLLHGKNVVNWRFVDFSNVPDGPWKAIITTSQVYVSHH